MILMTQTIDHNEYPKMLRSKTLAELRYIMKDAQAAIDANPDGPKVGYYLDEINYCCNEIHRRKSS